jgi:hypothetical protein
MGMKYGSQALEYNRCIGGHVATNPRSKFDAKKEEEKRKENLARNSHFERGITFLLIR